MYSTLTDSKFIVVVFCYFAILSCVDNIVFLAHFSIGSVNFLLVWCHMEFVIIIIKNITIIIVQTAM